MPPIAETLEAPQISDTTNPVADAARRGLTATPKSLPPWLFYDAAGSLLFEQITTLPEYYLTRTERDLFAAHATKILHSLGPNLTLVELGAGTAAKTGILLRALTQRLPGSPASGPGSLGKKPHVLYQPIDISPTALEEARSHLERTIPGVIVRPRIANYTTDTFSIDRPPGTRVLALYIGSSIGNFSPAEARQILARLRAQLAPGDALLLGTDLAPNPAANGHGKSIATLLAAYNDTQGITAAFNRNLLTRLNRELGADFRPDRFLHRALWNPAHSRIEMHLESLSAQTVSIPANPVAATNGYATTNGYAGTNRSVAAAPALTLHFAPSETIHTENSYKFTPAAITALLRDSAFTPTRTFTDPHNLFAVTLAEAV